MSEQLLSVQVEQPAPDFNAVVVMPDDSVNENFKLSDYRGKYVLLLFYPYDFTFVCPTEILEFNRKLGQFKEKGDEAMKPTPESVASYLRKHGK